jgi:hypothetical protein
MNVLVKVVFTGLLLVNFSMAESLPHEKHEVAPVAPSTKVEPTATAPQTTDKVAAVIEGLNKCVRRDEVKPKAN